MIMCGNECGFFGIVCERLWQLPIFSMEVVTVGIMHYSALSAKCGIFSGGTCNCHFLWCCGRIISHRRDSSIYITVSSNSDTSVSYVCKLSAFCSVLCCTAVNGCIVNYLKKAYLRAAAGGVVIIILTMLVGFPRLIMVRVYPWIASCMEGM